MNTILHLLKSLYRAVLSFWVIQQLREATPFGQQSQYMFRDNDRIYGLGVPAFLERCGIEVLKPLWLGRGVDVPMPIILLGALGGMATGGILGLFLGAVLLAIGYQIFADWVREPDAGATDEP